MVFLPPALLAAGGVLLATSGQGAGATGDSAEYLAAAESLLHGTGLARIDGTPFLHWPPFYPVLLAAFGLVTGDMWVAARLLGALSAAAMPVLSGLLVWQRSGSRTFAFLAAVAVAVWLPVVFVSCYVWSDGPFAVLLLGALLALERARGGGRTAALVAAFLVALASLTRVIGVLVAPIGALALIGRGRIQRSAAFLAIAAGPLAAWAAFNVGRFGQALGARDPAYRTWTTNLRELTESVAVAFVPWSMPTSARVLVAAVAGATLCALAWRLAARGAGSVSPLRDPILHWIVLYALMLLIGSSRYRIDRLDERLALPLLLGALVLTTATLARAVGAIPRVAVRRFVGAAVLVAAGCWIAPHATATWRHVEAYRRGGVPGFTDGTWRSSQVIRGFQQTPERAAFSNVPEALWLATRRPVSMSPRKDLGYAPDRPHGDLELLRRRLEREGEATLVWFEEGSRRQLYTPEELGLRFQLFELLRASDGAIYVVRPAGPRRGQRNSSNSFPGPSGTRRRRRRVSPERALDSLPIPCRGAL